MMLRRFQPHKEPNASGGQCWVSARTSSTAVPSCSKVMHVQVGGPSREVSPNRSSDKSVLFTKDPSKALSQHRISPARMPRPLSPLRKRQSHSGQPLPPQQDYLQHQQLQPQLQQRRSVEISPRKQPDNQLDQSRVLHRPRSNSPGHARNYSGSGSSGGTLPVRPWGSVVISSCSLSQASTATHVSSPRLPVKQLAPAAEVLPRRADASTVRALSPPWAPRVAHTPATPAPPLLPSGSCASPPLSARNSATPGIRVISTAMPQKTAASTAVSQTGMVQLRTGATAEA